MIPTFIIITFYIEFIILTVITCKEYAIYRDAMKRKKESDSHATNNA